ncbi:DUF7715 family protein [Streptomyces albicerus]|uniref:DUF7715 family protein n=1 Tax=Streptomyces albicerus TaxID=2569859 RepID=UPI00124B2D2E|nr:hypothetical protein [Streptomyces albicerus]
MKLLTATSRTQGQRDNDFTFCIEGELVIVAPLVCEEDEENPDGGCGCGRSFGGLNSGKATTTAVVSDLDFTRDDAALAVRSALEQSNFVSLMDPEEVEDLIVDTLELAADLGVGTVVEQRLGDIRTRP